MGVGSLHVAPPSDEIHRDAVPVGPPYRRGKPLERRDQISPGIGCDAWDTGGILKETGCRERRAVVAECDHQSAVPWSRRLRNEAMAEKAGNADDKKGVTSCHR